MYIFIYYFVFLLHFYKVYDVSQFIAEHPGGTDQIMLGAGRDITVMFDPYHPLDTHKYVVAQGLCGQRVRL